MSKDLTEARKELYDAGMEQRRKVMGDSYVNNASKNKSEFATAAQELVTEACWGLIWTRPGLGHRERSLVNIGMLAALGRETELAGHVRGALNNGCTEEEIREVLLQVMIYAGMPAGLSATRVADEVITKVKSEKDSL